MGRQGRAEQGQTGQAGQDTAWQGMAGQDMAGKFSAWQDRTCHREISYLFCPVMSALSKTSEVTDKRYIHNRNIIYYYYICYFVAFIYQNKGLLFLMHLIFLSVVN